MDTRETNFYLALLAAAFFLAAVFIVFIVTILRHHRKHLVVYKDKVFTEISILEMERKRMAFDLHDDLGPLLSSIKLQISCLKSTENEDVPVIERCAVLIGDALQKIRETSNNLVSEVLTRKGLLIAIRDFAETVNKTKQLEVEVDIPEVNIPLESDKELHLYRIFQEVLTNCIKHADASKFYIKIEQSKKLVLLSMRDDGRGFDYRTMPRDKISFGLKNIANRVEILNGQLFLDGQIGKGVQYFIEIPLTT